MTGDIKRQRTKHKMPGGVGDIMPGYVPKFPWKLVIVSWMGFLVICVLIFMWWRGR